MKDLALLSHSTRLSQSLKRAQVKGNPDEILLALKKVDEDHAAPHLFTYFYIEQGQSELAKKQLQRFKKTERSAESLQRLEMYEMVINIVSDKKDKIPETLTEDQTRRLVSFAGTLLSQYYFKAPSTIVDFMKSKKVPKETINYLEESIVKRKETRAKILKSSRQ